MPTTHETEGSPTPVVITIAHPDPNYVTDLVEQLKDEDLQAQQMMHWALWHKLLRERGKTG